MHNSKLSPKIVWLGLLLLIFAGYSQGFADTNYDAKKFSGFPPPPPPLPAEEENDNPKEADLPPGTKTERLEKAPKEATPNVAGKFIGSGNKEVVLEQKGNTIIGTYHGGASSLEGKIEGTELKGTFGYHKKETSDGSFAFKFSEDGNSFTGKWCNGVGCTPSHSWNTGSRHTRTPPVAPATPQKKKKRKKKSIKAILLELKTELYKE